MATDPQDLACYEAVLTAFRASNGAGDYHYDLTDAVYEGQYTPANPPRNAPPCVAVADPLVVQTDGPDLAGRAVQVTIDFQYWSPAPTSDAAGKMRARTKLAADLRHSLDVARRSGSSSALYGVHDLQVANQGADGRQLGLNVSCGYGEGRITFTYLRGQGDVE